jgi:hypothetical protein
MKEDVMRNVGTMDRNIRLVVFAVLLALGWLEGGGLGMTLWALSAVLLITALAGYCPLWALFKIDTVKH